MDLYQQVIYKSKYSRWLESEKRRETWDETVDRYIDFFKAKFEDTKGIPWKDLRTAIFNLEVMPSMRALMTAGKALDRDNVAGYNCSYIIIDSPRAFDEALYILCCGTGVGFSAERQYVSQLPIISEDFHETDTVIVVRDSKIGWASAFRELLSLLWIGQIPKWDTSKIRPAGAKLKTFGGRASGPEPLEDLFRFSVAMFKNAQGRKLSSIECHDLMCKVADIVVVGGVRRSALISLSNLSDDKIRVAKHGQWWVDNPQRQLANNSAVYTERPDSGIFMTEWLALYDSKSGERGIVNRQGLKKQAKKTGRRDIDHDFGVNPCGEIILRPYQFCNLTEVVIRPDDTIIDLERKVRLASILGTIQASQVNFRYLRAIWKRNTEEEALLGLSFTGIMDNVHTANRGNTGDVLPFDLESLKKLAIDVNQKFAKKIGVNPATSVTAVKPSGTVSQLVDSASGIHPRFAPHYIRRIRLDKKDPICQVLKEANIPVEDDEMSPTNYVFSFPRKCHEDSAFVKDFSAIKQLNHWLLYKQHWCEHNPSVTIYVNEDEWMKVGAWIYDNFDEVGGLSFFPTSNSTNRQLPYTEVSKEEYEEAAANMPEAINWDLLSEYEKEDMTESQQTLACTGNSCEI